MYQTSEICRLTLEALDNLTSYHYYKVKMGISIWGEFLPEILENLISRAEIPYPIAGLVPIEFG
jgi:hypothetical protein